MKYTIENKDKYSILKLKDDKLNELISSDLKSQIVAMNQDGVRNIILDLSEVSYCDSSGLSAILIGNKLCKKAKGSFVLVGLKVNVKRIITISQLDKVLSIVPSISEATDLIYMEEVERELANASDEE